METSPGPTAGARFVHPLLAPASAIGRGWSSSDRGASRGSSPGAGRGGGCARAASCAGPARAPLMRFRAAPTSPEARRTTDAHGIGSVSLLATMARAVLPRCGVPPLSTSCSMHPRPYRSLRPSRSPSPTACSGLSIVSASWRRCLGSSTRYAIAVPPQLTSRSIGYRPASPLLERSTTSGHGSPAVVLPCGPAARRHPSVAEVRLDLAATRRAAQRPAKQASHAVHRRFLRGPVTAA